MKKHCKQQSHTHKELSVPIIPLSYVQYYWTSKILFHVNWTSNILCSLSENPCTEIKNGERWKQNYLIFEINLVVSIKALLTPQAAFYSSTLGKAANAFHIPQLYLHGSNAKLCIFALLCPDICLSFLSLMFESVKF